MKKTKPKIIVILGQTATGKSDLAVKIALRLRSGQAKKFGGEIISADSRQVYTGLDLGTGKVTKKEMLNVSHYLLDVASPKRQFSVAEYKKLAEKKIKEILKRNKTPIIVGGTGFYIQSIVDNISLPEVPPNPVLRKKLEKIKTEKLFAMLQKLDKARAETIDRHNPRRLIRAIEIANFCMLARTSRARRTVYRCMPYPGRHERFSRFFNRKIGGSEKVCGNLQCDFLQIGIKLPDEILKERIYKRLISRINSGMLTEAKKLHRQGLSWKRMEELGLEYRYMARFLQGKLKKEEMIEQLNQAIWQYAKRQWTWFKRDKRIIWIDPTKKTDIKKLENLVKKFLK